MKWNIKDMLKDIKGFEGIYAINENGDIWSFPKLSNVNKKGKWLSPGEGGKYRTIGRGYKQVILFGNGTKKNYRIHRLVAETFIPKPDGKDCVNHKDGNTKNNNVYNLEWVTAQENSLHSYSHQHREVSSKTRDVAKITMALNNKLKRKLSYEIAQEIRNFYLTNNVTFIEAAKEFGTTQRIATAIIKNQTYLTP